MLIPRPLGIALGIGTLDNPEYVADMTSSRSRAWSANIVYSGEYIVLVLLRTATMQPGHSSSSTARLGPTNR